MAEQTFLNIANVPVDNSPVNIIGIDGESHWVKVNDFTKLIEGKDINPNSVKIGGLTYKSNGVFYGDDDIYGIRFLSRSSSRGYWPEVKPQVVGEAEVLLLDNDNSNFLATTEWVNRTKQPKLPTDGDGTKFLNDKGQYAVPVPQERSMMIFTATSLFGGIDEDPAVFMNLTPEGETPIANKDYVLYKHSSGKYLFRVGSVSGSGSLISVTCQQKYRIQL